MTGKNWTSVRIDEDDHYWLRLLSASSGMKMSEYLHHLIAWQVAQVTVTSNRLTEAGGQSPIAHDNTVTDISPAP